MSHASGHIYLQRLHRQWLAYTLLSSLLIALGLALGTVSLLAIVYPLSWWWVLPLTLIIFSVEIALTGILKSGLNYLASLLDRHYPQLEESTSLLIKPEVSLNLLERLQTQKVITQLQQLPLFRLFSARLKGASLILAMGIGTSVLAQFLHFASNGNNKTANVPTANTTPDVILPGIRSVNLTVSPPAYTRKAARRQDQFSASAEEGSSLSWKIRTNQPVRQLSLLFNDNERLRLRPSNTDSTEWSASKVISRPGFYQVDLEGRLSDLYKLEVIRDQPATVRIIRPAQYSSIDFGEPQRSQLQVRLTDDYGVKEAYISATIASGKGEGVKFKEQKLLFPQTISGAREYLLSKTIDLKALGMVPGDELYFYVQARDSRLQDSRSDIYIVTIQDTAQLMSMDGMLGGVNLVPEYFRSQRQIIIDTEKLLREKNIISSQEFNNRSNDIGVDQKLLRLRYGKFLGEEDESEIGGHQEEEEGHNEPADFGNAEKLLDAVAHKHDIAEDATFFEPELKAQLKATLAEMWKSELQLRLHQPAAALPFEYKALRLLKDLQQKSRVYVAKTAFKPPIIKAEKRLSGELDKIIEPQASRTATAQDRTQESLRLSAGILDRLKKGNILSTAEVLTLNDAAKLLAVQAAAEPAVYLEPLASLRSIIRSGKIERRTGIGKLEAALQKIITNERPSPQPASRTSASGLSDAYFNQLKKNK